LQRQYALTILLSTILLLPFFTSPVASQPAILIQRTWGGGSNDVGNSVTVDSSGNTYVTGRTFSFGAGSPTYSDVILIKYDASNNLVWQKTWGGSSTYEAGQGVAVDASGNSYVTGLNGTGVPGSANIIILKFDSTGLLLWQKTWGTSSEDQTGGVALDSTGNVYVAGYASSGAGGQDFVLLKFDSSGGLLWQKTWGGPSEDRSWSVAVDSSGSIYATGGTASFGAGGRDVVLLKFDSSGTLLWHRMWGGTGADDGLGTAVDSSGNIYVTGSTSSFGAGGADTVLLKFDPTGGLLWQRTWGGSGADYGQSVSVASSGSVYVTGSTDSFGAGLVDTVLLRFDSSGALVWQKVWGGINNDYGLGVAVGLAGSAVVTGYVSETQPYALGSPTTTPNSPTFSAGPTGSGAPGTPAFAASSPAHTPGTPSGSQSYSGGSDFFLFEYGDLPRVTFQTSPGVGSIIFSGVTYTNGQSGNYTSGEFTATAIVPSGHVFASWTASGGITVGSTTSNPTTVTVTGTGTLTANFTPSPLGALENPLLLVSIAVVAAAIVAAAIFFLRKRKKTSPPK